MPINGRDKVTDYGGAPPPWCIFQCLNGLSKLLEDASRSLKPPPIRMMDMTMSFTQSRMLFAVSQLGVPDILASGPQTAEQIVARIEGPGPVDPQRLERLLNCLIGFGVFQVAVEGGRSLYSNNGLSAVLRSDHPNTMKPMLEHQMLDCYESWSYLEDMLRGQVGKAWDKTPQAEAVGKLPEENTVWGWFSKHPEREVNFAKAMGCLDHLGAEAMVADGPFGGVRRVIDVGGSQGHLLHKILKAYSWTTGLLFDLPSVIETSKKLWGPEGQYHGMSPRVQLQGGSFMEVKTLPDFHDGDAIVMRYILHDWSDDEVVVILKNLRQAVGGKLVTLLICESAVPDKPHADGFSLRRVLDIHMLCLFSGSDRSPSMWKPLFEAAGWRLSSLHPTRSIVHWIEAKPV